jgi:nucleoside-diphosphate-sugar epimerase
MALMTGVDGSCDTSKIRHDLGYKETVSFSDAVKASVEWSMKTHPEYANLV